MGQDVLRRRAMTARPTHKIDRMMWRLLAIAACVALLAPLPARGSEKRMIKARVSGPFEVKLEQLAPEAGLAAAGIGRMSIDKTFHGELEGHSVGEMMATQSPDKSSGGYVALERVTATLQGRRGTFALQHSATMDRGKRTLNISVVPGSGTDGLGGITGTLGIDIAADGKHTYVFEYTLPEAP
jgi:hypothetical protein